MPAGGSETFCPLLGTGWLTSRAEIEGGAVSRNVRLPRANPVPAVIVDERPWGTFEQYCTNERCTVKTITVQPGHRLSLQRHEHRDELWDVLDVPVTVEVDGRAWKAQPGEKVWIPRGSLHRLSNAGTCIARVLEIAFGTFDECDIQRLSDDYSR